MPRSALRLLTSSVLMALGWLASTASAQTQLELPPPVPNMILEPEKSDLLRQRSTLEARVGQIDRGIAAQKASCSQVDSQDTANIEECRGQIRLLRQQIEEYRRLLDAFRCALAGAGVTTNQKQIKETQDALRRLGLATTAQAFEQIEEMTTQQKEEFKAEYWDAFYGALFSFLADFAQQINRSAGSIGSAQGKRYAKLAKDRGFPAAIVKSIEQFSVAKDKPAQARALNELIKEMKLTVDTTQQIYRVNHSKDDPDLLWNLGGLALIFVAEEAPQFAEQLTKDLARRLPSITYGIVRRVTVEAGVAVASPIVIFAHNMRALGYTKDAIRDLDVAADSQLAAVTALDDRMQGLVHELRRQRAILSACRQ